MASRASLSLASSSEKCVMTVSGVSAETSGDVGFGLGTGRVHEQVSRFTEFDQLSHVEERGFVGAARGLLHIMRDDHNGVTFAQILDELLDFRGRDRIECRAG